MTVQTMIKRRSEKMTGQILGQKYYKKRGCSRPTFSVKYFHFVIILMIKCVTEMLTSILPIARSIKCSTLSQLKLIRPTVYIINKNNLARFPKLFVRCEQYFYS